MQELLTMSMKELDRLRVIHTVFAGKLTKSVEEGANLWLIGIMRES